jgi:pantothenate kinase
MAIWKWRFWLAMNSKRGILGGFLSMFFATIVIVFILLLLIIGSGIIKMVVNSQNNAEAGEAIYDESRVGLDNVFNYVVDYGELVEWRRGGDSNVDVEVNIVEVEDE